MLGKFFAMQTNKEVGRFRLALGCLGSIVLSVFFSGIGVGQTESALKRFFERKIVVMKIDMPATHKGVDVHSGRVDPMDDKEYDSRLREYGTALSAGQHVMITKIKTKSKHIEFQLNGGGHGTFSGGAAEPSVSEEKSFREIYLEREVKKESNPEKKKEMEEELAALRRQRERRENSREAQQERIAWENARRLGGGSRFNIRYDSNLTDRDRTPEAVMTALSEYLEFPEETFGGHR